jgi:branched-chain amino acid transport system substrate-binding protein
MKTRIFLLVVIFLVVGFLQNASNSLAASPTEIIIGTTGPLTGPAAETGIAMRQGFTMAIEDCNNKGGIYIKEAGKKLPIKLLVEDNQSKPEVGVSVGEKMITRDKINVLWSYFHSSVAMAVMELAPKYGIPVFSSGSVSLSITDKIQKDPNRYWSYWKADYMGDAYDRAAISAYKYLIGSGLFKPRNKTVAFIAEDTDWGRVSAENTSKLFKKMGFKTVGTEIVSLKETDFYPQYTKLKALNPDILVTIHVSLSTSVAFTKQFQEQALKSSRFGMFYPRHPEFIRDTGKASEYLLWTPCFIDPDNIPQHKEFKARVLKRWSNILFSFDHVYGYDNMNVILSAINSAGSLEPKAIIGALPKIDVKGLMGRFVYDVKTHSFIDGEDYLPMKVAQIQNGKNIIIWPKSMAVGSYKKIP